MTVSPFTKRVAAITIALALTFTINTAISYAAKGSADTGSVTQLRSGASTTASEFPKPRSGAVASDFPKPRSGAVASDFPKP